MTVVIGVFLLFFLAIIPCATASMICADHPLGRRIRGELIRDWKFAPRRVGRRYRMFWTPATYIPRNHAFTFVPYNRPFSTKYAGLDFFKTGTNKKYQHNFLTVRYQRPAKIYVLIHAHDRRKAPVYLRGWKPEGWVRRKVGHKAWEYWFGLKSRKFSFKIPVNAYVVSKVAARVVIPSPAFIKRYIRGGSRSFSTDGFFSVLTGEADGTPVRKPPNPRGMKVVPGRFCPKALHDKWVTKGTDKSDWQTRNKLFRTWHPLWDPCYWCSYGHEHGSSARLLMNYVPRYGYTALKNRHEHEVHEGFKDIVLDTPRHLVYIGIHAHMSDPRRFRERFHTMVIAVRNKRTRRMQAELRFKADFGALTVRTNAGRIIGVRPLDKKIRQNMRNHRLINIINPNNIDRRWKYRGGSRRMRGEYEQWSTKPMCTSVLKGGEPTIDFKDPTLARRTEWTGKTWLGRKDNKRRRLELHPGVDREFRASNFVIAAVLCPTRRSWKFYTDVYGKSVRKGPGKGNVAQFMDPKLKLVLSGEFQPVGTWLGLYRNGALGGMQNIALGIDETRN